MFLTDPMIQYHLYNDGAIRRKCWKNEDFSIRLTHNDYFEEYYLSSAESTDIWVDREMYILDYCDAIANDWEIVEENEDVVEQ